MNLLNSLKENIHWQTLSQAILLLLPVLCGFLLFQNILLFNVGLVTISLFIVAERLHFNLYAIGLHFIMIFFCFSILFFSFSVPSVFVLMCAILGFFTIYCSRFGTKLRTFGNYTFIPTVYLACELHEKGSSSDIYYHFITLLPIALLSIWALYLLSPALNKHAKKYFQLDLGAPESAWLQPALAIFFGVGAAASLVLFFNISRGEWVIWSVASVITIELATSIKKFNQRITGLMIGVPLGFLIGFFLPKNQVIYSLATLAIMLTLVAFKRYPVAFGSRCFFISLAAYIASSTPTIAIERMGNVILGGIIGILSTYLIRFIHKKLVH